MNIKDLEKFNRHITTVDVENPLSIGNGDFCMTFDATTSQTLFEDYKDIPLTSMSNKHWFTNPSVCEVTPVDVYGKKYIVSSKGQEDMYEKSRQYPHKFNMFRILLLENNELLNKNEIENIEQEQVISSGRIYSSFTYKGLKSYTSACINQQSDELFYNLKTSNLNLKLVFLYPSYNKEGYEETKAPLLEIKDGWILITYDEFNSAQIKINSNTKYHIENNYIVFEKNDNILLDLTLNEFKELTTLEEFWLKDSDYFSGIYKLDERMVLSKYLLKINCTGIYPPAESGLTYNNWYSKFHLEMHLIHSFWLINSNHIEDLLKSFNFYKNIVESSKERASMNGYKGIRFPKMTSPDGHDSPSNIGPLLIWQAPHVLYMLQEIFYKTKDISIIEKYKDICSGVTDFMVSFLNISDDKIEMIEPLLECSESIPLEKCLNPMFEIEYFRECFKRQILLDMALFGHTRYDYNDFIDKLVNPKASNGIYLRTHGIIDSSDIYKDHPTEVFAYSYFKSEHCDKIIMNNTIDFALDKLDLDSFWGWDFPFMAMCLLKLGRIEDAINVAFMDEKNNEYRYNGHNTTPRSDLKIYLPANGAYLMFYQEYMRMKGEKNEK